MAGDWTYQLISQGENTFLLLENKVTQEMEGFKLEGDIVAGNIASRSLHGQGGRVINDLTLGPYNQIYYAPIYAHDWDCNPNDKLTLEHAIKTVINDLDEMDGKDMRDFMNTEIAALEEYKHQLSQAQPITEIKPERIRGQDGNREGPSTR